MKPLLFLIVFMHCSVFAQQQSDTSVFGIKLIEFRAGGLFSRLYQSKEGRPNGYATDSLENRFRPGFTAGVSVILINAKHITFQPEIAYNLVHHDIKYLEEEWAHGDFHYTHTYANYSLDASFLQFSFMVKYRFGKVVKAYIGLGGYYNVPVYNSIKGKIKIDYSNKPDELLKDNQIKVKIDPSVGAFAASGINIPYKRSNFGLEFRVYYSNQIMMEYFAFKQSFFTVNLIYQWKRKKNS